jgi:probable F420-dependent oxidoreductase
MSIELGNYGIWRRASDTTEDLAREVESLGFGSLWVGGSPPSDLQIVEDVIGATESIGVATGIVNVWREDASEVAESYHRIEERYPDRLLLGVGIGHPETTKQYHSPYQVLETYLGDLAEAGVPADRTIVAALGPRSLRLAAERTAGSHPYFTTPRHTEMARETMGAGAVLAPEQTVVVGGDRDRSVELARGFAARYLALTNYRNSLLREGWDQADLDDGGSERLIEEVVLTGEPELVAEGIRAHLAAGADNVNIQVLGDDPLPAYRALAAELLV